VDDKGHIRSTAEADAALESAALQYVLALHPAQTSFDELLRELGNGADEFSRRDAVERAVRDLTAAGLLQRSGPLVLPTRAALRFDELLGS
jgi:hypothetical protein